MYALTKVVLLVSAAVAASSLQTNEVVFHLFTRNNPQQSQPLLPNPIAISQSQFIFGARLIVTIHNHNQNVAGNFNAFVLPAHLEAEDVNVIAVDWSAGSSMYSEGLSNAVRCGELIASFINMLSDNFGYPSSNLRIVGIGLGAHIAGIAARKINGNVPHIVALDPSFHGWTHHPDRLSPDDATVVEVLHTTAGLMGYDYPLGDLDFYPNGGSYQNGCATDVSCSHTYAYAFYAESLTSAVTTGVNFVGTACEDYENAIQQQCSGARDAIFGGPGVKTSGSGIYVFSTNFVPPFARG